MSQDHYNPDPHAHPGLHVIAIIEAVKGSLALLAASGLELLGPAPLQRWVDALIAHFQLDPQHGAMAWLAHAISPDAVHLAAAVAALYLPFDLYAFALHRHWLEAAVVAINLLVVWVLARDLMVRRR